MPLGISEEEFMAVAGAARDIGLKTEIAGRFPIFELVPSVAHHLDLGEIAKTIRNGYGVIDVFIRFPDDSYRHSDICIFFRDLPASVRRSPRFRPPWSRRFRPHPSSRTSTSRPPGTSCKG